MRLSYSSVLAIAVALLAVIAVKAAAKVEGSNETASAAGLYWSNAQEEGDVDISTFAGEWNEDDVDGGFSSLDGMLQWAIGHSDPSKLKETAEDVKRKSPDELKKRQDEIKELIEKMKMPSDAELMKIAIDDLNNSSLPWEDHLRALLELSELVEPIDNANDLHKLGGTLVVVKELNHPDSEVRTTSALVLGKACQNNPVVQKQFLELGALSELLKMTKSNSVEEVLRALYAISALIRNNVVGQQLFYGESGDLIIQDLLSKSNIDVRIHKRSVSIVSDLAESQMENPSYPVPPFFSNPLFLRSVVDLLASMDLDLQEKVLHAVENLLRLQSGASIFKEFCELDAALDKMKEQLQRLAKDDQHGEHATDVEILRKQVQQIYADKINKVLEST
ncbi:OLC1v1028802C1 [Oldenlandia corymbosa var. corymbosa]|uniref:OLC1v1028802C1 n=1 Tax=Oldenlandia corymbosa var. corymbosa TaxID=529605 RepID=A0AAV1CFF7_OLDCO|nr:OLC1v1028802C1 [Oldenlandia corymbosa var. corymbosa]